MASQTATSLKTAKGEKTSRMPRKKLDHLTVKRADNGGHIVTDHFMRENKGGESMGYHPPEEKENVFTHGPTAVQHVMKHMGVKDAEMAAHLGSGSKEETPKKEVAKGGKKVAKAVAKEAEEPEEDDEA